MKKLTNGHTHTHTQASRKTINDKSHKFHNFSRLTNQMNKKEKQASSITEIKIQEMILRERTRHHEEYQQINLRTRNREF